MTLQSIRNEELYQAKEGIVLLFNLLDFDKSGNYSLMLQRTIPDIVDSLQGKTDLLQISTSGAVVSAFARCTELWKDGILIADNEEKEWKENTKSVIDSKEYAKSFQFLPVFLFLQI